MRLSSSANLLSDGGAKFRAAVNPRRIILGVSGITTTEFGDPNPMGSESFELEIAATITGSSEVSNLGESSFSV